MLKHSIRVATVVALLGPATWAANQDPAERIIADCLTALGGVQKLQSVRSLRIVGRRYNYGNEEQIEVIVDRTGRSLWSTRDDRGTRRSQGYDGTTAWRLDPDQPSTRISLSEAETRDFLDWSRFGFDGWLIDPAKQGAQVRLVGTEDVDGRPCHHLEVILADGNVQHWYLDQATLLPARRTGLAHHRFRGDYIREYFFLDYRSVEGLMVPHLLQREDIVSVNEIHVEHIEVNPTATEMTFRGGETAEP